MLNSKQGGTRDCFRCNEKYYAGHRCNVREKRELRTFVVRENGEELEVFKEEDCKETMAIQKLKMEGVENPIVELSINSVVGLTNLGTMKMRGSINNEAVIVLTEQPTISYLTS